MLPTIVIFFLSLWLTVQWKYPQGLSEEGWAIHIKLFTGIYVLWIFVYYGFRLFDAWTFKRIGQLLTSLVYITLANTLLAIAVFYIQPNLILTPRRFLLVHVVITFVLSSLWLISIRSILQKKIKMHVHFLELQDAFGVIKGEMRLEKKMGYELVSNITADDLNDIRHPERTLLVLPSHKPLNQELMKSISGLHAKGASFVRLERFYEDIFRRVYLKHLNEWWFIENINRSRRGFYRLAKRIIDTFFAILIGIVFIITYPVVAILVKLSDPGPIFFKQSRVALNGKIFSIYKYRTMRMGTSVNTWTTSRDPRITRVGRLLRKTRIDELPQCINILKGDMSFVGPRPEQAGIVNELKEKIPFYNERHVVRPGITGWGQLYIYAGTQEETKRKLQYDLYYLKHRSLLFDLEIIMKTVFHILFLEGR